MTQEANSVAKIELIEKKKEAETALFNLNAKIKGATAARFHIGVKKKDKASFKKEESWHADRVKLINENQSNRARNFQTKNERRVRSICE